MREREYRYHVSFKAKDFFGDTGIRRSTPIETSDDIVEVKKTNYNRSKSTG